MSKHSPGPWFFYDKAENLNELEFSPNIEADGRCIAQVNSRSGLTLEKNTANGRVMAAAPELLEAANLAVLFMRGMHSTGEDYADYEQIHAYKLLMAAIAKAEGKA